MQIELVEEDNGYMGNDVCLLNLLINSFIEKAFGFCISKNFKILIIFTLFISILYVCNFAIKVK